MNSQSGKGGVAYIMKTDHGIAMPRAMQVDFSRVVQTVTDAEGGEVDSKAMWDIFANEYLETHSPVEQVSVTVNNAETEDKDASVTAKVIHEGTERTIEGSGNGPIAAYADALGNLGLDIEVLEYSQHARTAGDDAEAACYILATINGSSVWGVGIAGSTTYASLKALVSAANRAHSSL